MIINPAEVAVVVGVGMAVVGVDMGVADKVVVLRTARSTAMC